MLRQGCSLDSSCRRTFEGDAVWRHDDSANVAAFSLENFVELQSFFELKMIVNDFHLCRPNPSYNVMVCLRWRGSTE